MAFLLKRALQVHGSVWNSFSEGHNGCSGREGDIESLCLPSPSLPATPQLVIVIRLLQM